MQFNAVVDVFVIMQRRLRSQDSGDGAGTRCKGVPLSVILALLAGGTLVFFVMHDAPCMGVFVHKTLL